MVRCDCRTCGRYKRNNCPFQTFRRAAKAEIARLTPFEQLEQQLGVLRTKHEELLGIVQRFVKKIQDVPVRMLGVDFEEVDEFIAELIKASFVTEGD